MPRAHTAVKAAESAHPPLSWCIVEHRRVRCVAVVYRECCDFVSIKSRGCGGRWRTSASRPQTRSGGPPPEARHVAKRAGRAIPERSIITVAATCMAKGRDARKAHASGVLRAGRPRPSGRAAPRTLHPRHIRSRGIPASIGPGRHGRNYSRPADHSSSPCSGFHRPSGCRADHESGNAGSRPQRGTGNHSSVRHRRIHPILIVRIGSAFPNSGGP